MPVIVSPSYECERIYPSPEAVASAPCELTHGRAEEGRVIVALVQPTVVMARQPVVAEPQVMQVRPVAPRMPPLAAAARLPRPAVRQATALMAWVVRRPVVMA